MFSSFFKNQSLKHKFYDTVFIKVILLHSANGDDEQMNATYDLQLGGEVKKDRAERNGIQFCIAAE